MVSVHSIPEVVKSKQYSTDVCFACIQSAAIVDVNIKNFNVDVNKLMMLTSTSTKGVRKSVFFISLYHSCCAALMEWSFII